MRKHQKKDVTLADWVRPLATATSRCLGGHHPVQAADALLSVGVAYGRLSSQPKSGLIDWARQAWDRCYNLPPIPAMEPVSGLYLFPDTLARPSEDLADVWVALVSIERDKWLKLGVVWGDQIKSSQVASFAVLQAAQVLQRTSTGFTPWLAAVDRAWDLNPYALEVSQLDAPEEAPRGE